MIERIHSVGRGVFELLRKPFSRAFESDQNPLNHLGALTVFFLWIILISGIWLLIFFHLYLTVLVLGLLAVCSMLLSTAFAVVTPRIAQ